MDPLPGELPRRLIWSIFGFAHLYLMITGRLPFGRGATLINRIFFYFYFMEMKEHFYNGSDRLMDYIRMAQMGVCNILAGSVKRTDCVQEVQSRSV